MAQTKQTIADLDELGWGGHVLTACFGLAALIGAVFAYRADVQVTLTVSLLVAGGLLLALSWFSLQGSRAAWSFLISMSIVLGIMTLFGAPKVRSLVGINLGLALVIPALLAVATFALSSQGNRYKV